VVDLGATDMFAGVTHGNTKSVGVLTRTGFEVSERFDDYDRYHLALDRAAEPADGAPISGL